MAETLIALVNPVEGRDDEFREWYWGTHVQEVLQLPGFVSAKALRLTEEPGGAAPFRYATLYEVEGSAVDARNTMFGAGLGMSDAMDLTAMIVAPYGSPATV
ncbi:DUF4286 family protein [Agromyces seonyuensis]|uniref:EthD family reductase n=1 Tax=Agromyces seonyuensis TaxID=2662446 RepID=A0A6I4NTI0_9MICO|nr:DUF4286 family protein [Agromyces seonyuensis]MWB97543.1 hypothetical protein [Agromyces seonyuensis]